MLPNGIEPPLKMLTNAQKIHATGQLLQDLTQCDKTLQIPGNFHAKQRRRFHDDSKLVFPENKLNRQCEGFETHYNLNFQRYKPCRPTERPCSPTRRNNPHPSKNFLTWRIPTRVFDYGKSKTANISFLNSNIDDSFQSFYNDYSGHRGGRSEVDPKMLLEMTKTYSGTEAKKKEKQKKGKILLKNGEPSQHALTLPSLLRKSWSPDQSSLGVPKRTGKGVLSPIFLKEELQPLFQSWYDAASTSTKDKEIKSKTPTVLAEIEESYIQKALEKALQPDAIEAIEDWLLQANDEEREIAMQFIQTIVLASLQKQKLEMTAETQTNPIPPYKNKALTPLNRGQMHPPMVPKSKPHHHTKACKVCARKNLEGALEHLQAVATMPHELPGITELINPLHPGVLAEREERKRFVAGGGRRRIMRPKKKTTDRTKSSLFQETKKARSRHFTVHPEWC